MNILLLPRLFRIKEWWSFLLPTILGYFLIGIYKYVDDVSSIFILTNAFIGLILLSLGLLVIGYLINEWSDIESDRIGGKVNQFNTIKVNVILIILISAFLVTLSGLAVLNFIKIAVWATIIQLLLFGIYNLVPFRFKKTKIWSIICDSIYSGLIFCLLAYYLVYQYLNIDKNETVIFLAIGIGCFCRGLRNILIHQSVDEQFDVKAGFKRIHYLNNIYIITLLPCLVIIELLSLFWVFLFKPSESYLVLAILLLLSIVYFIHQIRLKNVDFIQYYQFNKLYELLVPMISIILISYKLNILLLVAIAVWLMIFRYYYFKEIYKVLISSK